MAWHNAAHYFELYKYGSCDTLAPCILNYLAFNDKSLLHFVPWAQGNPHLRQTIFVDRSMTSVLNSTRRASWNEDCLKAIHLQLVSTRPI